jgi:cysteine desulfurase
MAPIYLDYNATTPVDPAVLDAMLPYLREQFGNPSSAHDLGKAAREAVDKARAQVAELISAKPEEIVFTSGGTESINHALKGVVLGKKRGLFGLWGKDAHIITSAIEHPATLRTCEFLKRLGSRITLVPVDKQGTINLDPLKEALTKQTTLVSIMHSNNEVGTLQPVRTIAVAARKLGVLSHCDAAQSAGKLTLKVNELGVDLLSLAGHKLYAPKGIGALYIRKGTQLQSLIHGADHEGGRRAGTENVAYIVGLGAACALARESLPLASEKLQLLRDRLWHRLRTDLGDRVVLNGHPKDNLPNTLHVSFAGLIGADLLKKVPEIAASTGAACHAGQAAPSHVLRAMGMPSKLIRGAVRISVGRYTTIEEIDQAADAILKAVPPAK